MNFHPTFPFDCKLMKTHCTLCRDYALDSTLLPKGRLCNGQSPPCGAGEWVSLLGSHQQPDCCAMSSWRRPRTQLAVFRSLAAQAPVRTWRTRMEQKWTTGAFVSQHSTAPPPLPFAANSYYRVITATDEKEVQSPPNPTKQQKSVSEGLAFTSCLFPSPFW